MPDQFSSNPTPPIVPSQGESNSGLMIGIIIAIILLIVVGGGYWWYQNQSPAQESVDLESAIDETEDDTDEFGTVPELTSEPTPVGDEVMTSGQVQQVTVTGRNFSFSPAEIRVKQGDTVQVTFKNEGGTHDWKLDEFNAGTPVLQIGQESTIEFVADKVGTFEYYCSVGNHRAQGMVGKLIVE